MPQYLLAVHHSPTTPQPGPEDMQRAFAQVLGPVEVRPFQGE